MTISQACCEDEIGGGSGAGGKGESEWERGVYERQRHC